MATKSQILGADPNKVLDLVDGWKNTVDTLEQQAETYRRYVERPGGSYWEGATAEAAQNRADQDYRAVVAVRDTVDNCADQIRSAVSSSLIPPLNDAKQIIAEAEANPGVTVNEDLSISYTAPEGTSDDEEEDTQNKIAAAEAELKADADNWWTAENAVAQQIRDAEGAIGKDFNFGAALYDINPGADDTIVGDRNRHVQLVDRTWKQDPAPNPNDPGRHPQYPNHKPDGTWARGNSGVEGYPEEQQAFNDREQRTGIPIERQKIRVTLPGPDGKTLTREYDGLEPIPGHPGQYLGLEHKLGDKGLSAPQKVFDGLVKAGIPAHGTLHGRPIEVIDTELLNTPRANPPGATPSAPPDPGSAPIISAPPNLPNVFDHPPVAIAGVQPDHPAPAPLPPTVLDHPPLPPWLKDPSPPGFHVSPSVPPDFAPMDTPGDNLPTPQHGPPITLQMPDLHAPDLQLSPEQQQSLETDLGLGGLGLLILGGAVLAL
jgi:uncharacterized protein YukE